MKIKLTLEGAFQAWGVPSEYEHRGTSYYPTARGIVGMIGCCLGIPRGDKELENLQSVLKISSEVNHDENDNKLSGMILTDYQTVSKKDGSKLNSANGGTGESYNLVLRKAYLNDASFSVLIEGPDELVQKIYDALLDPVWIPYLGRKNCMPTVPLIPVIVE
jgi:CRISPR system Cascade subunit CasD